VEITANIFPYEGTDYNFALVRDISERKRAERSLAEQVRFLQHLIDTIPSPIFFKDANGVYLGCNQSLAEFLGKPKGEIIGKTVFEIYPREHAEIFYQKDQALFQHPGTQIYEFMMERFDGTLRDFIFTKATFVNLAGKMAGLIGVMTDITERQQMEQALAVREREYRTLLENIPDLIVRYDLDMRRIYVNPAWEKASGLSAGEVINKPTAEIPNVPHPVVVEYAEKLRQVAEAGGPQALEFTWVNALGVTLFLEYVIVPEYDRSGKIVSVLAVGRDLTDRRRAEEEIRKLNLELEQRVIERTAELEAANQELEAFAYSVSHDLRAPLRHVDGFLELLQKRIAAGLDDKSQHYMATIFESTRRMGMLIDDLLSFSRMGRCEMLKKPVDLNVLVQEVIEEFKPETRDRLIRWQIADLPKVIGDRAMLRIVQVNLISNALKFSRPRQEAEIEIGWRPGHGTEIIIFIRDNGVGFDMNYAGNLFGVFQRLHRMEEFEGTGIGLANVRRIINRHGGRTWAEGKVDQGATFFFSLP
jgi:PAS domain S-box-containing protein